MSRIIESDSYGQFFTGETAQAKKKRKPRVRKRIYAEMGSVSSGTMRPEDLIPEFLWDLEHLARMNKDKDNLRFVKEVFKHTRRRKYFARDDDEHYEDMEELVNRLNKYALPYFYFGSHPGDGSDFGFWLSEMFDMEFDGKRVSDLNKITKEDRESEVLFINDHGNMTLYWVDKKGKLHKIWSIV